MAPDHRHNAMICTHRISPACGIPRFLSHFSRHAGLVHLRQTFVLRCHGDDGWPLRAEAWHFWRRPHRDATDYPMPNVLNHLAAPSSKRLGSHWDRCGVHYVDPTEGARIALLNGTARSGWVLSIF